MIEFRNPSAGDEAALGRLWADAFGESGTFVDLFMDRAYSPSRCRLAVQDGELLAALYWLDCSQEGSPMAYLYGVATAPRHQHKGIGSLLLEDTHSHLNRLGYAAAVLVPGGPELFRFYQRLGYKTMGFVDEYAVQAGPAVPLTQISSGEYGALRSKLLPPGGIRQEGENLALLDGLARLYRGEGFLAAVSRGDPFVMELLGDPSAAPGILGALGIPQARFRLPGTGKPFAMIRRFDGKAEPIWFGLAFD